MTKTDDLDQLHKIRYHVAVLTKNDNKTANKKVNYISYKQKKLDQMAQLLNYQLLNQKYYLKSPPSWFTSNP